MQLRNLTFGLGLYRHLSETISRRFTRRSSGAGDSGSSTSLAAATAPLSSGPRLLILIFLLLVGAFVSSRWINSSMIIASSTTGTPGLSPSNSQAKGPPWPPLACPAANQSAHITCPSQTPPPSYRTSSEPSASCPAFFRWIHEDLRPWAATGITTEMVERARRTATFRLVVLGGRAYVERYGRSFQTRDVFTIWGILQLLRRYPGQVPDLDIMFDCVDYPILKKATYHGGRNALAPPPLFRYCGDDSTLDLVFPDWSFWGWPEINIPPWEPMLKDLKQGNERVKWMDREPYAYWKGNPAVAAWRRDLLRCNVSDAHDWHARLYAQDWERESRQGYKDSKVANQCLHRYKIYIEGSAWSVSEKYILACDSPTLLVKPRNYDFFTRGLMPLEHYWPIRDDDKCRSIEFAVDWGNNHKQKAQAMGREASLFVQEQLKMDYVYDYMFHMLNEYAKLFRFKPTKPPKAIEYCSEFMACPAQGLDKKFMVESIVKAPQVTKPCTLPPPFHPSELKKLMRRKVDSIKQVEHWERKA
uniref:O-glucosyltransferase rumi n=1 Tax=Anthurium amnicola TaxID=1678845 RepID=A0A1D1XS72_9ARAE